MLRPGGQDAQTRHHLQRGEQGAAGPEKPVQRAGGEDHAAHIKSIPFFRSQSLDYPLPRTEEELTECLDWYDIFFDGNYPLGELDLPKGPTDIGSYSVTVYFNGAPVATNEFTIA